MCNSTNQESRVKSFLFYISVILVPLMLAGCQSEPAPVGKPTPTQTSIPVVPQVAPAATPVREKTGLCLGELASLKQVNSRAFAVRSAGFDRLVSSAGVYIAVRDKVSSQTKNTLDALYKYKTNQMCAEIERELLQALIRRGEIIK